MLSLPGMKLSRTKEKAASDRYAGGGTLLSHKFEDLRSLLRHLSQSLAIETVTLVDTSTTAIFAKAIAAGPGTTCDFTLPTVERHGKLVELLLNAQVASGKGKVFASGEIFPIDAAWCDFLPMDITVDFCFLPLSRVAHTIAAPENLLDHLFLLTTSTMLDLSELKSRSITCACLIAASTLAASLKHQVQTNQYLIKELNQSGKATCIASSDGTFASKSGWLLKDELPGVLGAIHRSLEAEGAKGDEAAPIEITIERWQGIRARAYPLGKAESRKYLVILDSANRERQSEQTSASSALMRFMSSIAHEIKNPLTGIAAGVQYLARKLGSGMTESETVEFILSEINRLNRIVDDLYRIARPPELNLSHVNINETVTKSLLSLSEGILRKQLNIVQNFGDLPEIEADADRLQQVIINILKNAIEVSPQKATIKVTTGHSKDSVWIEITDQGPGIPAEDEEAIFEPFYSTKPGGTGLGLSISSRIIEQHGGSISIERPPGGGASFVVRLPLGEATNG